MPARWYKTERVVPNKTFNKMLADWGPNLRLTYRLKSIIKSLYLLLDSILEHVAAETGLLICLGLLFTSTQSFTQIFSLVIFQTCATFSELPSNTMSWTTCFDFKLSRKRIINFWYLLKFKNSIQCNLDSKLRNYTIFRFEEYHLGIISRNTEQRNALFRGEYVVSGIT